MPQGLADTSHAEGSFYGADKVTPGQSALSANAWNSIVRATNAARTMAANGAPGMVTPYGSILSTGGRARVPVLKYAFRVRKKSSTTVEVAEGYANAIKVEKDTYDLTGDSSVYVKCTWKSDTSPTLESAEVVVLSDIPDDTETEWYVRLADVVFNQDGTAIKAIVQTHLGNIQLRRSVFDFAFRVRVLANGTVKMSGGAVILQHSVYGGSSQSFAPVALGNNSGTLWVFVPITNGTVGTATLGWQPLGDAYPEDTGFYRRAGRVSNKYFPPACSTGQSLWQDLLTPPNTSDGADSETNAGFAFAIADVHPDGAVRQRQMGDIRVDNVPALAYLTETAAAPACNDIAPRSVKVCVNGQECDMTVLGTNTSNCGGSDSGGDTPPPSDGGDTTYPPTDGSTTMAP